MKCALVNVPSTTAWPNAGPPVGNPIEVTQLGLSRRQITNPVADGIIARSIIGAPLGAIDLQTRWAGSQEFSHLSGDCFLHAARVTTTNLVAALSLWSSVSVVTSAIDRPDFCR